MKIKISEKCIINGHEAERCPKCGGGMLPNQDGVYCVAGMTPDETARCFNCGYVAREGNRAPIDVNQAGGKA